MSGKTYLERYLSGEYLQVWEELTLLDTDAMYKEPLFSDAYGVAQETMRRVRHNIELLIQRWKAHGLEFEYPDEVLEDPYENFKYVMKEFEKEIGRLPLSIRAFYEIMGGVNLSCKGKSFYKPGFPDDPYDSSDPLWVYPAQYVLNDVMPDWERVEKIRQTPPDGCTAYLLDLIGRWKPQQELRAQKYETYLKERLKYPEESTKASFAPDHIHKDDMSGGGSPELQLMPGADCAVYTSEYSLGYGRFRHSIPFVDYLRLAINWAGFPGFSLYGQPYSDTFKPDDDLPQLLKDVAKDLLPF